MGAESELGAETETETKTDTETPAQRLAHGTGPQPSILSLVLSVGGEIAGLLMQMLLIWVGARLLWGVDDEDDTLRLFLWCTIATLYLGATVLWLTVLVKIDRPDPPVMRLLVGHPLTRMFSMLVTFGASFFGFTIAVDLITSIGQDLHEPLTEGTAVWAMLLSWIMFNWGYARIYFSRYHRAATPPLQFPETPQPTLVDFAYFAFTNATTFSVSDVRVVSTPMRWTVVWHTTLAFFFNALIIALSMNVIAKGQLFATLLG